MWKALLDYFELLGPYNTVSLIILTGFIIYGLIAFLYELHIKAHLQFSV